MKQHQKYQDNVLSILKKKIYSKPVLTVLGEVSELTTGGSTQASELSNNGECKKNVGNGHNNTPRC
ncbi:MAG: lasso RiPP family leader peptide-containing protein [Proteobacteria bacterium]|nr:lasso RiPP family leader peptide-containing protein [Pseudomonadota bacterium]